MQGDKTDADRDYRLNRRKTLSALGTGAGTLIGLGAFTGSVAAWKEFDVCFRGCSEIWMIVSDTDVGLRPPAVAKVIVASGGEAVCHEVEFAEENATKIPGQFGERPVVKYAPGGDDKILGVLEIERNTNDLPWCVHVNENNCSETPGTPDVHDAPCVPDDHPVCPSGDFCGGTGGGPPERGNTDDRRERGKGRRGPP